MSKKASFPDGLGFRDGKASVHTSRTMMLEELTLLLDQVRWDAPAAAYGSAIVEENVCGKPTQTTRQRTAKRLAELYALDPSTTLFRLLRHFWPAAPASRPLLAFLTATARDPLLRETTPFIQAVPRDKLIRPDEIAEHLSQRFPSRFQESTALATAQRLASTWTQAGYLRGKVNKRRARPHVTPIVAAFALVLGYLCGLRGKLLLDSVWTRFLDRSPADLADLAAEASKQGWLNYRAAGAVVEVTFPGLLKPEEERAGREQD